MQKAVGGFPNILTIVWLCISVSWFCQYAASFHGSPQAIQAVPWILAVWVFDTPYKTHDAFTRRQTGYKGKYQETSADFGLHRTDLSGSLSETNKCSRPFSHMKTCRPTNFTIYMGYKARGRLWQSLRGVSLHDILFGRSLEKLGIRGNRLRRKAAKVRSFSNKK